MTHLKNTVRGFIFLILDLGMRELEEYMAIKLERKTNTLELQRVNWIKKIAQAQIDKIDVMKDLADYEIKFSNYSNFLYEILETRRDFLNVIHKQHSKEKRRKLKRNLKVRKQFNDYLKSSLSSLSNIMQGYERSFTLFESNRTKSSTFIKFISLEDGTLKSTKSNRLAEEHQYKCRIRKKHVGQMKKEKKILNMSNNEYRKIL